MIYMIRLKELRQEKGLNQKELASQVETTQRNISNWENGNSEPDIQMLIRMSKFFEVSVDYLLNNNDVDINANVAFLDNSLITAIKNLPADKKRALLILLQDYYL